MTVDTDVQFCYPSFIAESYRKMLGTGDGHCTCMAGLGEVYVAMWLLV